MIGLSYSNPEASLTRKNRKRSLEESFSQPETSAIVLFNLALMIGVNGQKKNFWAIEQFVERYPLAANPAMVFLAKQYRAEGMIDLAATVSRQFLRNCHDAGILQELESSQLFSDAAVDAFEILAEAYVQVGAYSYAIRVLELGMDVADNESAACRLLNHIQRRHDQLEDEAVADLDGKWEAFFISGKNFGTLSRVLEDQRMKTIAHRCKMLDLRMQIDSEFTVDHEEILMSLHQIAGRV